MKEGKQRRRDLNNINVIKYLRYYLYQTIIAEPSWHTSVVSIISGLVNLESYCVSYPVTLYCYSSVTKTPYIHRTSRLLSSFLSYIYLQQTGCHCRTWTSYYRRSRLPWGLGTRLGRRYHLTLLYPFTSRRIIPIVNPWDYYTSSSALGVIKTHL